MYNKSILTTCINIIDELYNNIYSVSDIIKNNNLDTELTLIKLILKSENELKSIIKDNGLIDLYIHFEEILNKLKGDNIANDIYKVISLALDRYSNLMDYEYEVEHILVRYNNNVTLNNMVMFLYATVIYKNKKGE